MTWQVGDVPHFAVMLVIWRDWPFCYFKYWFKKSLIVISAESQEEPDTAVH